MKKRYQHKITWLSILCGSVIWIQGCSKPDTPKNPDVLCSFDEKKIWKTAPKGGFKINIVKKHVTEGETALEVRFPKRSFPGINTNAFDLRWGNYEYVTMDVYNKHQENVPFSVRIDDVNNQRANVNIQLKPGANKIRIPRSQLEAEIDPNEVKLLVLFLVNPKKKYTLVFDNLKLVKSDLIPGIEDFTIGLSENRITTKKVETVKPIEFRKAVPVAKKAVDKQGQIKVAIAKLKNVEDKKPYISSGVPFQEGQLFDTKNIRLLGKDNKEIPIATKILAHWPRDKSIRSVLIQFKYPIDHIYEYITFEWGIKRKTKDRAIRTIEEMFPEGLLIMPKEWLAASGVIGEQVPFGLSEFKAYDDKIVRHFTNIKNMSWTGDLRQDGYYSTAHTFYQFYVRTGEIKYFLAARKELIHYRDTQIHQTGKDRGTAIVGAKPRYMYVQALMDDYFLTGDEKSKEVAGYMAEYLYNFLDPKRAFYKKKSQKFWTERLVAFPLLGMMTYYEMTLDEKYLKRSAEIVKYLYKTQLEWPARGGYIHNLYAHDPEEGAGKNEYGGSPFMAGLLLEGVIKFHQITQSDIAADSIFRAADWIINEGIDSHGTAVKYMTSKKHMQKKGAADMNMMVVHALGYAYRMSGYTEFKYIDKAQILSDYAIRKGYAGKRKHFNQQFRSSGHYLAYIKDGIKKAETKKIEETIIKPKGNIYHTELFEYSTGRFKPEKASEIEVDSANTYLNGSALKISSKYMSSTLGAGIDLEAWPLEKFNVLTMAYRIPENTPVGIRVLTNFGDYICLAGSVGYKCGTAQAKNVVNLISDGKWHELELDVKKQVQSVVPAVKIVQKLEFYTRGNAQKGDHFWIDDFKLFKKE